MLSRRGASDRPDPPQQQRDGHDRRGDADALQRCGPRCAQSPEGSELDGGRRLRPRCCAPRPPAAAAPAPALAVRVAAATRVALPARRGSGGIAASSGAATGSARPASADAHRGAVCCRRRRPPPADVFLGRAACFAARSARRRSRHLSASADGIGVSTIARQSKVTSGFCVSSARRTSGSNGCAADLDVGRRAKPVEHARADLAATVGRRRAREQKFSTPRLSRENLRNAKLTSSFFSARPSSPWRPSAWASASASALPPPSRAWPSARLGCGFAVASTTGFATGAAAGFATGAGFTRLGIGRARLRRKSLRGCDGRA